MNRWGLACEGMIRELLPEIGIPHKFSANGGREWYWRASIFEDRTLGLDDWVTLSGCGEVAVDWTVISIRNHELLHRKVVSCLNRGIVPVVLEQGMLRRAMDGSRRALVDFGIEIRCQIPLKLRQINGQRMTRERAARLKAERR